MTRTVSWVGAEPGTATDVASYIASVSSLGMHSLRFSAGPSCGLTRAQTQLVYLDGLTYRLEFMAATQIRGSTQIIGLTVATRRLRLLRRCATVNCRMRAFIKSDGTVRWGFAQFKHHASPMSPIRLTAGRGYAGMGMANVAGGVVSSTT